MTPEEAASLTRNARVLVPVPVFPYSDRYGRIRKVGERLMVAHVYGWCKRAALTPGVPPSFTSILPDKSLHPVDSQGFLWATYRDDLGLGHHVLAHYSEVMVAPE